MKLSDHAIVQIVKLVQMGILTGTDVVDQIRTLDLVSGKNNELVPTPEFSENFDINIQKMVEAADKVNN